MDKRPARDRLAPAGDERSTPSSRLDAQLPTTFGVTRISSHRLFNGAAELQIDHEGSIYRLKRTSLGKLILTK